MLVLVMIKISSRSGRSATALADMRSKLCVTGHGKRIPECFHGSAGIQSVIIRGIAA